MRVSKRVISGVLVMVMLCSFLSACSNGSTTTTTAATTTAPAVTVAATTATAAPEPSVADDPKVLFRMASVVMADAPAGILYQKYCDMVEEESGGSIVIELYPGSSLMGDSESVEAVATDVLEMAVITPSMGVVFETDRRFGLFAMPTLLESPDHARKFLEAPEVHQWYEDLAESTNIRILGGIVMGVRHTTSSKEIHTTADMAGVKFRISNSIPLISWVEAVGATPIVMALGETYLGLQQGVVDASENPLPTIISNSFHEVQKYLIKTAHAISISTIGISEKKWQALTDRQREVMIRCALVVQTEGLDNIAGEEIANEQFLKDRGMIVIEPDKESFDAAGKILMDKMAAEYGQELRDAYDFVKSLN